MSCWNMYVSKQHEAVVLDPSPLLDQLYPDAMRLPDARVVLPHNLNTFKALQTHGVKLPHPLLTYYDWGGGTPFETQKLTALMLVNNRRAYVLNDMGTGKTRAALWAWHYLYRSKNAGKLLVVCPLSVMRFGWAAEVFRTLPGIKVAILHGTKSKRLEALNSDVDVFVINHDGIKVVAKELAQRQDVDTLILDELATYRNSSQRTKAMVKLAAPMRRVWGLTGGPMPNAPTDVFWQCKILTPTSVPKFFSHFQDQLMFQVAPHKLAPREGAIEAAYRVMQPAVRFKLDDVVELPPVIERTINVPLTEEQDRMYKQLAVMFQIWVKEKKITAINAAVAMTKLLQISAGWVYSSGDEKESVILDGTHRQKMLLELIEQCERKVIVFGSFRHVVEGLAAVLDKEGVDYAMVHGGVSPNKRPDIFHEFQNTPRFKCLLAHPGCMSHGLTLTAADTVIWYCPITSYDTYSQADARIRRVGQMHKQQIIHLQSTPVERRVYSLLRSKQTVQDKFLEMFLEPVGDLNGPNS